MKSTHKSKDSNTIKTVKIITFIAILVVISVILTLIFRSHTTTTTVNKQGSDTSYIDCLASNPNDPFFISTTAESVSHEVKIILIDDKASKLSYNFHGTYSSNAAASKDIDNFNAKYYTYMGDHNLDHQLLSPNLAAVDTTSEVSLFAPLNKISSVTSQFFFLNEEQYQNLTNYSPDDLKDLYKKKGFLCETGE